MTRRLIFIAGLTLFAAWSVSTSVIYFLSPTEIRNNDTEFNKLIPSWLPAAHVKLGLDLQGGVQLVLGVNTDGAVAAKLERVGTELVRWAKEKNLGIETAYRVKDQQILRVELKEAGDADELRKQIKDEFPEIVQRSKSGNSYDYGYSDAQNKSIKAGALEQAERVIRNRIDKWGVTEPQVSRRADGSILVQLPGFSNPEKAKELLGRTAQLQFKIVDEDFTAFNAKASQVPAGIEVVGSPGFTQFASENKKSIQDFVKGLVPEDRLLLFEEEPIAGGGKTKYISYVVYASTEIGGEDILDANVSQDSSSLSPMPAVSLKFSGIGGKRFAEVTGANVGKRMAIVLDDMVVSAPQIKQKISGGQASISLGRGSYQEIYDSALQLSTILKSGALPATIEVLEERQVGASLGPELQRQGLTSILFGFVAVLLFMLFVYRRSGAVACLALILNALFLLSIMAGFGFALTMPGIAGFILTLGMAVDANVLINERIKQELNETKNSRRAIESAIDKTFWTIFDANVTTLIAAVVLLETNASGPIRGFAITLMIGLTVSMFTSLFCTRAFFEFFTNRLDSELAIRNWFGGEKRLLPKIYSFDFIGKGRLVAAGFVLFGLLVITWTGVKGLNWSVDFAGGSQVELWFGKNIDPQEIRNAAGSVGIKEGLMLQALEGRKDRYLLRYDGSLLTEGVEGVDQKSLVTSLIQPLSGYDPSVVRVEFVGPQIGKELRTQGSMSVFFALLGVLAYILLRFDLRYAPGALVKMFFDILAILGFYAIFQRSFDLTSVAALLTVVGYSMNDAVVIFDRIRENLGLHPRRPLIQNVNMAVNETIGRTVNTSLTTMLSLLGILLIGSDQIWNFAASMAIGIAAVTISSMFLASNFVIWTDSWNKKRLNRTAS